MFARLVAVCMTSLRARDAAVMVQSVCLFFLTFSCRKCTCIRVGCERPSITHTQLYYHQSDHCAWYRQLP
ncbi:hypothetical protein C8Q74DRAFT_683726 [Fomes fomentarius]|nr:hypothetical protein C8Q74DRAFT_683726 [Fomes fomentarius]